LQVLGTLNLYRDNVSTLNCIEFKLAVSVYTAMNCL